MKKILGSIILLVLLLPFSGVSQKKKDRQRKKVEKEALEYYDRVFADEHKMFSLDKLPEEYQAESKIILGQQIHFALLRNTSANTNRTKVALRKKVYLNDEAAINEFSEFYYQNSEVIGITIIKADGSKTEVDLSKAVEVTTEVPKFYQDRFHSDDYYKIAIPGLEIGDVVDYFKVFNESYMNFIELVIPVASEASIIEQEIVFDVDKLWSAFYKSYNGASNIKLNKDGGIDQKGRQRKSVKRLIFNSKNTPIYKENRWSYDLLHEPLIKFMALPPNVSIGEKKLVSEDLDEKELFKSAMSTASAYTYLLKTEPKKRIKALNLAEKSKNEAADLVYRILRISIMKKFDPEVKSVEEFSFFLSRNSREIPGGMYSILFTELLEEIEIESEIVMIMPKARGELSDILLYSEPTFGVYIPSLKKYYWPTGNFSLPGKTPAYLQGSKGIKINAKKINKRNQNFTSCMIPLSDIEDNKWIFNMDAAVESDNKLNMNIDMYLSGYYRDYYSSLFLFNTNYLEDEIEITKADMSPKDIKRALRDAKKKSKKSKKKKKSKDLEFSFKQKDYSANDFNKDRKEMLDKWIKSDYDVTEFGDFEIVDNGMTSEDATLHIKYDFNSDSYVNKAGPNLVFNIGKLIGDQVELTEEEINERNVDINFATVRHIENNINITIPEGKTAKGIETLNISVVNEIGEFVSTAEQIGDVIKIKTVKKYKNHSFPASEWSKMVAFLEAGFQFTEKKVILK